MNFIIGVKAKGQKTVSSQLAEGRRRWVVDKEDGRSLTFCWRNDVRLNANNPDIRVNSLDLRERLPAQTIRKGGGRTRLEPETIRRFGWITDHEITRDNREELCCPVFREALAKAGSRTILWRRMLSLCYALDLQGWDHLLNHLAGHRTRGPPAVT